MIASVSAAALDGARVLEIGGGIGRIQAELLATGADQGEVVELVGAYEPYARELARESDSKPERRSASSTSSTSLTRWSPLTSSC